MGRLGFFALMCSLLVAAQNPPSAQNAPVHAPSTSARKTTTATSTTVKAESVTADSISTDRSDGITRDQADAILNELKAIHQLLIAQGPMQVAAPAPVPAPPVVARAPANDNDNDKVQMKIASGWHWMGRDDAPVTMVEFTDYQCPFCRRYHTETFVQLKKNYIDTGKVRFVSRDLPLGFHANAEKAAEAAWCAGEQNKYWELRDAMIDNSSDLSPDAIVKYAQANGLDMASFKACAQSRKYKAEIEKDMADAGAVGISATPSFVIGRITRDALDGDRVVGAVPQSVFETEIQKFMTSR
jgi:protein-disulfide isomerase